MYNSLDSLLTEFQTTEEALEYMRQERESSMLDYSLQDAAIAGILSSNDIDQTMPVDIVIGHY